MAVDAAVIGPTGRVSPYFDDFGDDTSDDDDDDDYFHSISSSSDDESCSCDTDDTHKIANLNEENKIRYVFFIDSWASFCFHRSISVRVI
jgi:hypothetical protein